MFFCLVVLRRSPLSILNISLNNCLARYRTAERKNRNARQIWARKTGRPLERSVLIYLFLYKIHVCCVNARHKHHLYSTFFVCAALRRAGANTTRYDLRAHPTPFQSGRPTQTPQCPLCRQLTGRFPFSNLVSTKTTMPRDPGRRSSSSTSRFPSRSCTVSGTPRTGIVARTVARIVSTICY